MDAIKSFMSNHIQAVSNSQTNFALSRMWPHWQSDIYKAIQLPVHLSNTSDLKIRSRSPKLGVPHENLAEAAFQKRMFKFLLAWIVDG